MSAALSAVVRPRSPRSLPLPHDRMSTRVVPRHTAGNVIAGFYLRAVHDLTDAYIRGEVEGGSPLRSVDRDGQHAMLFGGSLAAGCTPRDETRSNTLVSQSASADDYGALSPFRNAALVRTSGNPVSNAFQAETRTSIAEGACASRTGAGLAREQLKGRPS